MRRGASGIGRNIRQKRSPRGLGSRLNGRRGREKICYDAAMLELTRTVRFCLNGDGTLATDSAASNTFAWWPAMRGLGRYYELEVTCRGEADPVTGYFMNIKRIDEVVRQAALPRVSEA